MSEIIRQGGREFAAAAQSGRHSLTTLFLIRCPFVKRVTETVRWHPRAQHSVHIVTAVQCDSILRKQQDYVTFFMNDVRLARVLLNGEKVAKMASEFAHGACAQRGPKSRFLQIRGIA